MLPSKEILDALELSTARVSEAGGATGRLWKVDTGAGVYALRLAVDERSADLQTTAMQAAAAGGIPVPATIRREQTPAGIMLLQSWLPGRMASDLLFREPDQARPLGQTSGRTHRAIHEIAAPESLIREGRWTAPPFDPLPPGNRLLHLDFHPNNLLMDEAGNVCAVLDWENAAAGDPVLDLARTRAIMTLDPAVTRLPPDARAVAGEYLAGWLEGYGQAEIPVDYQIWAARVMLHDLRKRFAPTELQHLRDHVESLLAG